MKIAPHVARKAVARKTKKTMPHVAQEVTPQPKQITPQPLPKAVVRKTNRTMPHVARSTENVIKISDYATRGTIHGNGSKQKSKTTPQPSDLPVAKWFTFERVKPSIGTVAYRYRWHQLVDRETGIYKRMPPVYVRYLTDAADEVLRRKGKDVIKQLVKQWYEQKCGQVVSAGEGMG